MEEMVRIGILTISDRACSGEYEDKSGPAIEAWLRDAICSPWTPIRHTTPDGIEPVRSALLSLCDQEKAALVLSTGGTGPAPRDATPEAMRDVIERELPGFGELMRQVSLQSVPTAILSRQSAGIRGRALIVTLPGRPASIAMCLNAVFPAIPYCLDLIGAGRIETHPDVCQTFRPP
jgi:molybdopterin adenylyltransferase